MSGEPQTRGIVFGYTPTSYETTAVSNSKTVNQERAEATRVGCETRKKTRTKTQGSNVCLGNNKTDYETTAQARKSADLWGEKCVQEKVGVSQQGGRIVSIVLGNDSSNYESTAKSANQTDIQAMRQTRQDAMDANDKFKSVIKNSSISFDTSNPSIDYRSSNSAMFNSVYNKTGSPDSYDKKGRDKPMTSADFRKANFSLGTDTNDFMTESRKHMQDPGSAARYAATTSILNQGTSRVLSNVPIAHPEPTTKY